MDLYRVIVEPSLFEDANVMWIITLTLLNISSNEWMRELPKPPDMFSDGALFGVRVPWAGVYVPNKEHR
jgi:hypothetical protein